MFTVYCSVVHCSTNFTLIFGKETEKKQSQSHKEVHVQVHVFWMWGRIGGARVLSTSKFQAKIKKKKHSIIQSIHRAYHRSSWFCGETIILLFYIFSTPSSSCIFFFYFFYCVSPHEMLDWISLHLVPAWHLSRTQHQQQRQRQKNHSNNTYRTARKIEK